MLDDSQKHLKYKEFFNELSNERIGKIYNTSKKISFSNLSYHFKGSNNATINFINFRGPMHIYNEIQNGNKSIEKIEEAQKQSKSKLNKITIRNPKNKSKDQLDTIKNIKNLYNSRGKAIKLYNDYTKNMSEAIYKTKHKTWLQILTPKQILKRLPIFLAQVKAGNNSENLLNEIGQTVYSLYQLKEITKKVYNNIT